MDPRHQTPEYREFKYWMDMAKDVERAGDNVGSNDPALANLLYSGARGLRKIARGRYPGE